SVGAPPSYHPPILANDTDADGDALTQHLVSGPSHGTVSVNNSGDLCYAPDMYYSGSDSFTYLVNDGAADSNVATVSLNIIGMMSIGTNSDYFVAPFNGVLDLTGGTGTSVLSNDVSTMGGLSALLGSGPSHGTLLSFNSDGSFAYQPDQDWYGVDTFTYIA